MTRPAPTVTVPVEPYMGSPEALAGMTQAIVKADAEFGHELSAYRYRTLAQAAFDTVFVGLSAALRAQPQAREDAQPVAWLVGKGGGAILTRAAAWAAGKRDQGVSVTPLYTHPAPDALRVAVEALEKIKAVRVCRDSANIWTGADACRKIATEAIAALQAEQGAR